MSDTTSSLFDNIEEQYEAMIEEYHREENEKAKNSDKVEEAGKLVKSKSSKRLVRKNIHRRNSHNNNTTATPIDGNVMEKSEIESITQDKIVVLDDKSIRRRSSKNRSGLASSSSSSSKY